MQRPRSLADSEPRLTVYSYWQLDDNDPRCGNVVFTNTSPLAGTYTNVMFDSTNVPAVVVGRQGGKFFRTDRRIDMNLDGDSDLLWQNTDGRLGVWFMTNSIGGLIQLSNQLAGIYVNDFYTAANTEPDTNWVIVAQKDINTDGVIDWVWQNKETSAIRVWYMGFFSLSTTNIGDISIFSEELTDLQPDNGAKLVAVSDFNNDGEPDYLFCEEDSYDKKTFIVLNGETFDSTRHVIDRKSTRGVAAAWHVVGMADVNNDGWPDILWQHERTGAVIVWLMKGDEIRAKTTLQNVVFSGDLKIVGNSDVDHDGYMDILLRSNRTQKIVVWYLRGLTVRKVGRLGGPSADWQLVGPR
jgi:hypothetical protein